MNFDYDSWNRILTMEYPDGEKVDYKYNVGGLLSSMKGFKGNAAYPYIDSIQYNKFEAKTGIYYGNGTYATYDYDILQRLEHLTSYTPSSGGETMQDIYYTFDGVNNITQIVNGEGILVNGLGGKYESNYTYDNLYRLTNSSGYWDNGTIYSYNLSMGYSPDGRIVSKTQDAMQFLDGGEPSINYNHVYNYNSGQSHTLTSIGNIEPPDPSQEVEPTTIYTFEWDANGNLIYYHHNMLGDRRLCWDEENRLMGVGDDNFVSYYMYDAGGERTYKLTGAFQDMIINGQQYNYNLMNNATLYASPYLVATPQGYTKHYYAGSERILSKIGGGGLSKINTPFVDNFDIINEKIYANYGVLERTVNLCLQQDPQIIWDNLTTLKSFEEIQNDEQDLYYYHPDHLGSGTWITYTDGSAIQHLHYLPFGEEQIDQRLTGFNSRYTFSAKEKDIETGYSYFGARYYTSDLSIWLSVDPMSDKYPSMTPYNYCNNNPVILVDPDGMDVEVTENGNGTYTITGGTFNKDKNIYIVKDGKRTGDVLGQTLTEYSFFNEENQIMKGAEINTQDNSGKDFIHNLDNSGENLANYMLNATNGEKYDFKSLGYKKGDNKELYQNRGMPLNGIPGVSSETPIYGTARDVGNYAAGMVAAKNGLDWGTARMGFDGYQSYKSGRLATESTVTQSAQYLGFKAYGGRLNAIPGVTSARFIGETIRSTINKIRK